MQIPTVVLVDLAHGGRLFRIEREQRTGIHRYFVDGQVVTVRAYLAAIAVADVVTNVRAYPYRIA